MTDQYTCPACGAHFATEPELRQHGAMHRSGAQGGPGSFVCTSCGARFRSGPELQAHAGQAHRK
jgi:DNA-directed RNA polymerase subunit RPC12/RpoP